MADPIKYIYIFFIRINSQADIAMSVCRYEHLDLRYYIVSEI